MSKLFIDFKPAKLSKGKCWFVYFYAKNPFSEKLERIRIKINHITNKRDRLKYATLLIYEINQKLMDGYNPFLEEKKIKPVTLIDSINIFLKKHQHLREDSIRSYTSIANILIRYLESKRKKTVKCYEFTDNDASNFINSLTVSNTTKNNYIRFLRTLFNWLIEHKYTDKNPFSTVKIKKQDPKFRDVIPPHIRKQIKEYLDTYNPKFYIFCQFTYKLLLRPSETFRLKIEDIDFEEKMIILPAESAKDHDNRIIYLTPDLWEYIQTLENLPKELYIFSTSYEPGTIMKDSRYSGKYWARIREKLQFSDRYTLYSLKDTGITELLEAGTPPRIVQQMAGHSSLEMTEKYTHRISAKRMLQYNKLEF